MHTGNQLVDLLVERGAVFRVEGDGIAFTPPPTGCSDEELTALRSEKEEIRAAVERVGGIVPLPLDERIPPSDDTTPPPLTIPQEGIWYVSKVTSGLSPLVTTWGLKLTGTLEIPALERALTAFVRRHDVLGLGFREENGRPGAFYETPPAVELTLRDFTDLPEGERNPTAIRWAEEEAKAPFSILKPPLIRFELGKLGPEEHVMLLIAHEMGWDGWCYDIFIRELGTLYAQEIGQSVEPLAPLPIRFRDYAFWHRSPAAVARRGELLGFWKETLGGELPDLALPTDFPRPPHLTYEADRVSFRLEEDQGLEQIRRLVRQESTTTFTLLLTVYFALLSRLRSLSTRELPQRTFVFQPKIFGSNHDFLRTRSVRIQEIV